VSAPARGYDEHREVRERLGEALARLLARRWRDHVAALAERTDQAAPETPPPDHQKKARGGGSS
jgi:hypothetical protein